MRNCHTVEFLKIFWICSVARKLVVPVSGIGTEEASHVSVNGIRSCTHAVLLRMGDPYLPTSCIFLRWQDPENISNAPSNTPSSQIASSWEAKWLLDPEYYGIVLWHAVSRFILVKRKSLISYQSHSAFVKVIGSGALNAKPRSHIPSS